MKYPLSKEQIDELKTIIDRELEARSFHVKTTLTQETKERGETRLYLTSEQFYTVPTIHRNLHITDFGGFVFKNEEEANENILDVTISVYVKYTGNATGIFDLHAKIRKDMPERVFLQGIKSTI